ncbi:MULTISPECIES: abortive infection family protein [Roseibium]|uniref:abortive infection family protein n=1 Tax=Roseibium TaxID=150830 RepID=UPI003265601A
MVSERCAIACPNSHGRGGKLPVKPSPRHASLAVNTAGAIATFLVETYQEKQQKS